MARASQDGLRRNGELRSERDLPTALACTVHVHTSGRADTVVSVNAQDTSIRPSPPRAFYVDGSHHFPQSDNFGLCTNGQFEALDLCLPTHKVNSAGKQPSDTDHHDRIYEYVVNGGHH